MNDMRDTFYGYRTLVAHSQGPSGEASILVPSMWHITMGFNVSTSE